MRTSLFLWQYLRPSKFLSSIIIIVLAFSFFLSQNLAHAGFFQNNDSQTISDLLKSELHTYAAPDNIRKLPQEKQSEIKNTLLMLQAGSIVLGGKTDAEKALSMLTQLMEDETNKNILSSALKTLLKMTNTPVSEVKDRVDAAQNMFYIWASLKTMAQVPRDGIMREYVQERRGGKTDNQAWSSLLEKYKENDKLVGCRFDIPISTGDDPITNCPRTVAFLKANRETGDTRLHSYAKFMYDSYALTEQFNNSPELKESLKQQILSEIAVAQKSLQPSFLSRIATTITTTMIKATGVIQTFVTNAAQIVTNSLKIASTGVKDFFTGAVPPKETEIKPSDLLEQISSTIPANTDKNEKAAPPQQINALNQQEQLRQVEEAKKKQAEEEKKWLEAEQQKQEDQRKIEEQRNTQAAAEEAFKKAKPTDEQPTSGSYKLNAFVVDQSGAPLGGRKYSLISPPKVVPGGMKYDVNISGTTDATGRLEINNLGSSEYCLLIEYPNNPFTLIPTADFIISNGDVNIGQIVAGKYIQCFTKPTAGTSHVTITDAENVAAAQAAVAAIKQPWSPIYNNNRNIITNLQAIVDRTSTGVTVTIKTTDNPQIRIDGTIIHPDDMKFSNIGVIGNVTLTLTKGTETVYQTIPVIIFPLG